MKSTTYWFEKRLNRGSLVKKKYYKDTLRYIVASSQGQFLAKGLEKMGIGKDEVQNIRKDEVLKRWGFEKIGFGKMRYGKDEVLKRWGFEKQGF